MPKSKPNISSANYLQVYAANQKKKSYIGRDVLQKTLDEAISLGVIPDRTRKSQEWFFNAAVSKRASPFAFRLNANKNRKYDGLTPGHMFFFQYDPKLKETLPYYDTFPCIFPLSTDSTGFLGINLHYSPLMPRFKLMNAILNTTTDTNFDESTQVQISYQILVAASKYKWFRPCIKRYLYSHVKSKFYEIEAQEWSIAAFLPWANWKKASEGRVFLDSDNMFN